MGRAWANAYDRVVSPDFMRRTPPPETAHSYLVAPLSLSHWNAGVAPAMMPLGDTGLGGRMMNLLLLLQAPVEPAALARTLHVRSTFAGREFRRWRDVPWWPLKKRSSLFPWKICRS